MTAALFSTAMDARVVQEAAAVTAVSFSTAVDAKAAAATALRPSIGERL